jgi:Tfp pilus assembly PilM family ATPase
MANRTGIELLPDVCRIVEVRTATRVFGRGPSAGSRVRVFHEIPYTAGDPGSLTADLRPLMNGLERRAAVALWGLRSTHQVLLLPPASSPADLEAMARQEVRAASGHAAADAPADGIVVGGLRADGRREVGYVSVPSEELRARLLPLVDAGFVIDTAVTPAVAHAALVRQRQASLPDAITAVLSVNGRATALTVLRGSLVLFARELPWGHETEHAEDTGAGDVASAHAARLASELRRSLVYLRQTHRVDVSRVLVCGDLPDLRSLTGPLMHDLDVEVETLDLPDDLDLSHLQEQAGRFSARLGAWRTAVALATDPAPPVNLARRGVTALRSAPLLQQRTGAAVMAGVLIVAAGWGLVTFLSGSAATEQRTLRRIVGALEPEMDRQAEVRRHAALASARQAALRAFASQGPRLARVLEAFSRTAPDDIALTELTVEPGAGYWRITAEGRARGASAPAAQASFGRFLKALDSSALLGHPVTPPSLRVRTEDPVAGEKAGAAEPPPPDTDRLPQGVQSRQPAPAGPDYIEVVREGRPVRIPLRRQSGNVELERQKELRMRPQPAAASDGSLLAPGAPASAVPMEPQGRRPASVLDFTLHFRTSK